MDNVTTEQQRIRKGTMLAGEDAALEGNAEAIGGTPADTGRK